MKEKMLIIFAILLVFSLSVIFISCDNSPKHSFDDNGVCKNCGYFDSGLEFELNDDGQSYRVVGIGTFTGSNLVIPSVNYDRKPITGISFSAFFGNKSITSVTIPDSVKSIGYEAFRSCSKLKAVSISNVESIGYGAFCDCTALESVIFGKKSNITSISGSLFSGCTALATVNIPYSVKSIESNAFADCSSLVTLNIPNSVEIIGESAFRNAGLSRVILHDNLISIGVNAFSGCRDLKNVDFDMTKIYICKWYITEDYDNWVNKKDGIEIFISNSEENASILRGWSNYYWYKTKTKIWT